MKGKNILIAALFLSACAALVVFSYLQPALTADGAANGLINDIIGRVVAAAALSASACLLGYGKIFTGKSDNFKRALLWCVPCLLVTVANFPFSALIRGTATIERYDLIGLFVADCLAVACMEEVLFRGILLCALMEVFNNKYITAVLAGSAVFALCHMFNLFSGASVGGTVLQVGYTFLMSIVFSAVFLRTENIWISVLLHAVFNIGGNLVTALGGGAFQDGVFWILTAVFGVICAVHIALSVFMPKGYFKNLKGGGDHSGGKNAAV